LAEKTKVFGDLKKAHTDGIELLNQNLSTDKKKLNEMKAKKSSLLKEVENLEDIKNKLPQWCQNS
jgi:hypothetical protein